MTENDFDEDSVSTNDNDQQSVKLNTSAKRMIGKCDLQLREMMDRASSNVVWPMG